MNPSENISNKVSTDRDTGIIKAILESGTCVELPAEGYSMFPVLMPGYRVIVQPLPEGVLPEPGSVVVYNNDGILVMHRLLEITDSDNVDFQFIARGDSRMESDKPCTRQQLLGAAVRYKVARREHPVKKMVLPAWRYKFNNRLLWVYLMARKIRVV